MKFFNIAFVLFLFVGCNNEKKQSPVTDDIVTKDNVAKNEDRFRESYRPQYHFSPPEKWMNDPNGLLFYKDTYHLFYQYYPEDIVWGPMHWGHATSKDLIKWEHKPIALYPDKLGLIFSGSAVMDINNTSGLGTDKNPPMVAIFTYHLMEGEKAGRKDYQTQGIAYSLDEGETWTKYEGNPVIGNETNIKDFRDPKVMWHQATNKWVMSLVAGDHAKFYSSPNLKDWTLMSEFGKDKGAHGGVWECPDLFPLTIPDSDETKWVLFISTNPGGPNGGSGTQYFVGDFDGTSFTTDQKDIKWLDYGTDNYAGVTYNGLPDSNRTFIGWMSNWDYGKKTPTEVWRSAMTLPRKLTLIKKEGDYLLKNYPIKTINEYSYETTMQDTITHNASIVSENFNEMRLDFTIPGELDDFQINFTNAKENSLKIGYKKENNTFFIDRSESGKVSFEPRFAEAIHTAPGVQTTTKDMTYSIFMDESSIELFVNNGEVVMTEQVFPDTPYTKMTFTSDSGVIAPLTTSKIKRIWD